MTRPSPLAGGRLLVAAGLLTPLPPDPALVEACWCIGCRAVRHPADAALDCLWCPESLADPVCVRCWHLAADHDRTGCRVPVGEPYRAGPGQIATALCPCGDGPGGGRP